MTKTQPECLFGQKLIVQIHPQWNLLTIFSTIEKFSLLQDQFLEQMVKVTLGFPLFESRQIK